MIKEMIYANKMFTEPEILARDFYKGFEYFVVSLGSHPCAYIALSKGQPFYDIDVYEDVEIDCHGGCTYCSWGYRSKTRELVSKKFKVIGWDYAHCGDFKGGSDRAWTRKWNLKKYSTEEMVRDCKNVIEQLYVLEHFEIYYK